MSNKNRTPTHPEELADLADEYASRWRTLQTSTLPADRPRAESAIRGLYAEIGRADPEILWVGSPVAGAQAYHLARMGGRKPILGRHVRGDIGSGANREWNALAEPFDLPPSWLRALRASITRQLPADVARSALGGSLFSVGPRLRMALEAHLRSAPRDEPEAVDPVGLEELGRAALGPNWDRYEQIIGPELVRELTQQAVTRVASSLISLQDLPEDRVGWQRGRLATALHAMQPGQLDAVWPAYGLLLDVLQPPAWHGGEARRRRELLQRRIDMAASVGPWWALEDMVIVSERPLTISLTPRGRLHSAKGPAIAWPDGQALWGWEGVIVPAAVVTDPARIDVAGIGQEANVEVRRVMIERAGWDRVAAEGGARMVNEDSAGRLWETAARIEGSRWGREARFVEVVNSTPEPDGSRRHYFIRVPPTMQTARQAVAWTFELGEVEYQPMVET